MRLMAACMLALCLVVSGCGHDDTPASPIASATTSPPANPGERLPALPAQAKLATREGAAAFVSYYLKVLDYSAHTGNVDRLTELSNVRCKGCYIYIDLYRKTYEDGGWLKANERSVKSLEVDFSPGDPPLAGIVTTVYRAGGTYKQKAKDSVKTSGAESAKVGFEVRHINGGWVVYQYGSAS